MSVLRRIANRLHRAEIIAQGERMKNAAPEIELRRRLEACATVVDLGCGANPVEGATAAVDAFIDARQRGAGRGAEIDDAELTERGIRFVRAGIDERLPFEDGSFDFAYSSHAIEHVEHPGRACDEMMRIAKQGLVRCPAAMAEYLYGREYHRWIVHRRAGTLVFIEKSPDEFSPFGSVTDRSPAAINPFEALLDWRRQGPRTPGGRIIGRLKRTLQHHFYDRTDLSEVNLFWRGGFRWAVLRLDGTLEVGGHDGEEAAHG